jgi:hypothetical protein
VSKVDADVLNGVGELILHHFPLNNSFELRDSKVGIYLDIRYSGIYLYIRDKGIGKQLPVPFNRFSRKQAYRSIIIIIIIIIVIIIIIESSS